MSNIKLLEIIGSFSPEEKVDFPLFLNSPYFVRGGSMEEMLRLFEYLLACNSKKGETDKMALHANVFPEKVFSVSRLDRAYARLLQLAEQFLVTQFYQRPAHEQERELDLVRVFKIKGLTSRHDKNLQKLIHDAEKNPLESTEHYLFRYHLAKEAHDSLSIYNNARSDLAIPQLLQNLQLFYCNELHDQINLFLLQQKAGALQIAEGIKEALELSNHFEYFIRQSPLLEIRRSILALFLVEEPDPSGLEALIKLLEKHKNRLSNTLLAQIYGFIRSYCGILINYGHPEFRELLHEIHKDNLSKGYFYYKGQITPFALLGITRGAVILHKMEWARRFVEAHKDIILTDQEDHEEIYQLNLAVCFFGEKNFEQVLLHLPMNIKNHVYMLYAKRLELMAYYELRSELLPYKIDAFRKHLERTASQKSSSMEWNQHYNFYKLLVQISQYPGKNTRKKTRLIEKTQRIKLIAERGWLLEKAEKMV